MKTLHPVDDRIVVTRLKGDYQSKGGIYLPDTEKRKSQFGYVVVSGPGKIIETQGVDSGDNFLRIPNVAETGDVVVFNSYSGNDITLDGTDYVILLNQDVLAIVEEHSDKA